MMTRRTVIWSPLLLGVRRAWSMLAKGVAPAGAGRGEAQARTGNLENGIWLENSNHKLAFDSKNARLLSLQSKIAPGQEFAIVHDQVPAFVIQYLSSDKQFVQIPSTAAKEVNVQSTGKALTADFTGLGGLDLAATVTVRLADDDPSSHWSISIRNHANLLITDVQFPFVVAPYHLGGKADSEALLQPMGTGRFWEAPKPEDLEPDSPHAWQFRPENSDAA